MQTNKRKSGLDNNASCVIVALSKGRKGRKQRRMSKQFEVEYKGVVIRCETAEEAVRIAKRLGADADSPQYQPWKTHEFEEFVGMLQFRQRRLLAALLETPEGLLDRDLCVRLGVGGNRALAGVLSGITKVALAQDIDPARVYKLIRKYDQGLPIRRYLITQGFGVAASDNSWPSQEDLEEKE